MTFVPVVEPTVDEVRACVARILDSDEFRTSPTLSALLGFTVERALEGRADTLDPYTLATQALGQPKGFDPASDPTVRVEATRLRRALDRYYSRAGASDPVVFSLPRGSYVPVIARRGAGTGPPPDPEPIEPPPASPPPPTRPGWRLVAGVSACVAVAVTAGTIGSVVRSDKAAPRLEAAVPALALVRSPETPAPRAGIELTTLATINIPPLAEGSTGARSYAILMTERIRSGLARFDDIAVVELPAEQPPTPGLSQDTYALLGRITREAEGYRLAVRLRHELSRQIVWSAEYALAGTPGDSGGEMAVIRQIAAAVASPLGVIAADPGSAKSRADPLVVPASCIMAAEAALAALDPSGEAVRGCLEQTVASSPRYAPAFALLARLDVETWRVSAPGRPDLLDRALERARMAVQLSPQAARNHLALSEVLAARGERQAAEEAARRALELNPYSPAVTAGVAFRDVEAGRYREAAAALDEISAVPAPGSPWHSLYLALLAKAVPDGPALKRSILPAGAAHPAALLAGLLAGRGTPAETTQLVAKLRAQLPAAMDDPRAFLSRFNLQQDLSEAAAAELLDAQARQAGG